MDQWDLSWKKASICKKAWRLDSGVMEEGHLVLWNQNYAAQEWWRIGLRMEDFILPSQADNAGI